MASLHRKARLKFSAIIMALGVLLGLGVVSAPSASAAGYLHVYGNACPGGYITSSFIYVTDTESGYGDYVTNEWHVHLNNYDGDEEIYFSVRCNNGVWYFPIVHVTGFPSPRYVGWI